MNQALARLWKKPDKSEAEQFQTMARTALAQERLITLISGEMETILQVGSCPFSSPAHRPRVAPKHFSGASDGSF